ncbi:DinB family protein [Pseudoflavitalea sp. G-6-1-2]|uniref:DinB family protein n=1 Tax=Pseudoflavitalea sp. G-6-1-2 TaxID=2728841 RepID=UPI00146EFDD0|nr:DinB family protein [Pseudoflavitalea sp. G-6-1-2]NML23911.1 DinB family protein [Pseudoflavitalea sp. G-6-1-2]
MIRREKMVIPESYKGYTDLVTEINPVDGLLKSTKQFRKLINSIPKQKADYAYAPGKWTLKELLQHIIDSERVFVYRSLHMARKDAAALPGFEENDWADASRGKERKWKDLIEEFFFLRKANELFFVSLNEQQLLQTGTANNNTVSVAALALAIAGHLRHHIGVIEKRYLKPYPAKEKSQAAPVKKNAAKKNAAKKKAEVKKKEAPGKKKVNTPKKKSAPRKTTETGDLKKDVGFATPKGGAPVRKKAAKRK